MKQKLIELKRNSCTIIFGRHPYPALNNRTTRKINKETEYLSNTTNQQDLTDIYWIFHTVTKVHISQMHMEYFPEHIMFQAIKQIWTHLKKQTPYKVSFPTTTECSYKSVIENWKTHKFMEIEQHTLDQWIK